LIYDEPSSLQEWENGNILFMRNWLSTIQSIENMYNSTGITILPGQKTGLSASTLGGWNLGVSRYSNNPFIAAKVIEFLTSEYSQKKRALKFKMLPAINNLYEGNSFFHTLLFFKLIYMNNNILLFFLFIYFFLISIKYFIIFSLFFFLYYNLLF